MKNLFIVLPLFLLTACAKPDSTNLEDKRNRELEIENENTNRKAQQLEADLSRKQRLFSALKGSYEGTFIADRKEFKTRMTLVPNLPPYEAGRVRTLEEITADLNNIYFTAQIVIMNKQTEAVAMDCTYSQIKPDYDAGQMNLASEKCFSLFFVSLYSSLNANSNLQLEKPRISEKSQSLAQKILAKQIAVVNELFVEMNPTLAEKSFLMILKRTQ